MKTEEMIESYRKLEGANVARIRGFLTSGEIEVTYMNGYKHTFRTVGDVEAAQSALHPSQIKTPIIGSLLFGIIGAPN